MCAQRSVTHISQQIMNSIITSVYYITHRTELSHKYGGNITKRSLAEAPFHRDVDWLTTSETTWFSRREIHRVEVYYDRCRSYYPNSSRIPHPYNDNIRVQIVRNYINYYIATLAESKVAFIQNSLKMRSPNSSVGRTPQPSNSLELYSSAEPVCQNLSVRFVLATPTLWALLCGNWMQVGYNQKEPIRLGFPMY